VAVFDVDAVGLLARELVRERVATLVAEAGLAVPVPPAQARPCWRLSTVRDAQEVLEVLPHLPVEADTADLVAATLAQGHRPPDS
jgi:hypothetical protein